MKKLIALLLALIMVMSMVACGSSDETAATDESAATTESAAPVESEENVDPTPAPQGDTPAQLVIADFRDKVGSAASMEELATTIVTNENMPFMGAAMAVEPGFLNGFTAEIDGFEEGAMFSPMIGSIPFVGYVFRLADGADANAFVDSLREKADLRWNICTAADEMAYDVSGNVVCFVMAPTSFEE